MMTNSFLLIEISQPYVPKYIIISFSSSQFFFLPHPSLCSSFSRSTLPHLFSVYRHLFFEGFSRTASRLPYIQQHLENENVSILSGKIVKTRQTIYFVYSAMKSKEPPFWLLKISIFIGMYTSEKLIHYSTEM